MTPYLYISTHISFHSFITLHLLLQARTCCAMHIISLIFSDLLFAYLWYKTTDFVSRGGILLLLLSSVYGTATTHLGVSSDRYRKKNVKASSSLHHLSYPGNYMVGIHCKSSIVVCCDLYVWWSHVVYPSKEFQVYHCFLNYSQYLGPRFSCHLLFCIFFSPGYMR